MHCFNTKRKKTNPLYPGSPSHAHYRKQNRCCSYLILFFLSLSVCLCLCLALFCSVFTSHLPPCYLQPASQPIFFQVVLATLVKHRNYAYPWYLFISRGHFIRIHAQGAGLCMFSKFNKMSRYLQTLLKQMHRFSICPAFLVWKRCTKKWRLLLLLTVCQEVHVNTWKQYFRKCMLKRND